MPLKIDTTVNVANIGAMAVCLVSVSICFGVLKANQEHDHETIGEVKASMREFSIAINGLSQNVAVLTQQFTDANPPPRPTHSLRPHDLGNK